MGIIHLAILAICLNLTCYSQDFKIKQGEEIKMNGSSTSLEIIDKDNSGVYLLQGRAKNNVMSSKEPYRTVYTLYKFDENNSLLFSKEHGKEFKEYDLNNLLVLNGGLYMFTTDFNKKEKTFTLYGSRISITTGESDAGFVAIGSFPADDKDDASRLTITTASDGKTFFMNTEIITKTLRTVEIYVIDTAFRKKKSTTIKYTRTGPTMFFSEDLLYANDRVFVLEKQVKKVETKDYIELKQLGYSLVMYNMSGKREKEVALESEEKFISKKKLSYQPG